MPAWLSTQTLTQGAPLTILDDGTAMEFYKSTHPFVWAKAWHFCPKNERPRVPRSTSATRVCGVDLPDSNSIGHHRDFRIVLGAYLIPLCACEGLACQMVPGRGRPPSAESMAIWKQSRSTFM